MQVETPDAPHDGLQKRATRFERLGLWLCLCGLALGTIGLVDELTGAGVWAALFPGEPLMRPNTALGLALIGGAGALRCRADATRARKAVSVAMASAALAIGVVTLAEYAFAIDLKVDRLLVFGPAEREDVRPAPLTALGFTLIASAILVVDVRPAARARPGEWLAFAGWLVGVTAFLGFAFRAAVMYRLGSAPLIGVAPPAAIGMLLVSTGILFARSSAGLMKLATAPGPGSVLFARLVPAAIFGPALLNLLVLHVLRALGVESAPLLGAVLAASTTAGGLLLLLLTAAPLARTHDALEHSRARFRSLVELAPEGVFLADLDGRLTDVNSAGCRMLDVSRDELVGTFVRDLVPDEQKEQLEGERERLSRGEEVISEWMMRKKDGTWLPAEISAKILPDGRWQGFIRDISERKRLQAALQAANADLVRAQTVADVGSWHLDFRNNTLRWSDGQYRVFGVAPGTPMTYEAFLACVHPDDRAYVEREWNAALRGQPYDIEHRIVVDGAVRWVREKADLEFDENHTPVEGIGVTLHITERKVREEELRRAQERLDLAVRGADLATWDWNVATGEVIVDRHWAEMRGYRSDEITATVESWKMGVHPDDWPRTQHALDDHLQGRRPDYECEHRVRTKSGEWIWLLDRGKVFARNERGEPIRMLGTVQDVTRRKQAEEALRLSEAKAAGIISVSADAIICIDDQQRITLFNEGAEQIFGYAKAEAIGATLDLLVPERLSGRVREHVERFASGEVTHRRIGEPMSGIVGRRKNGEEFPADASISKTAVNGAKILTVSLRDVSEQRRHEEQQRFLAELGAVLAYTLDPETIVTSIGRLATRTFADLCILYVTEDVGEVRRLKAFARDSDADWICKSLTRMPVQRAKAKEVWTELEENRSVLIDHMTPEKVQEFAESEERLRVLRAVDPRSVIMVPLFARGRFVGAMGLVSSAPDRVYTRDDVRFAEQIAQRAAFAIDNSHLYATVRRAIHARDSVLGVVAHDLRNPLGTILLQAELLRYAGTESRARSRNPAETIERCANRMERIIQDLLDVTRIGEGRLSVERARVSALQIVSDVVEAQESHATVASLELRLRVRRELPDLWADRDRVCQIFENLITNAMKFTQAGGNITVGAEPRDAEVLFWVADTGAGIGADDLPHIFDPFWQSESRDRRGVGLGLSIVKGLVEAHGGHIWVTSTLGRGTTFFFTIPSAQRNELPSPEPGAHA